jgi:hypothetical protein
MERAGSGNDNRFPNLGYGTKKSGNVADETIREEIYAVYAGHFTKPASAICNFVNRAAKDARMP